MPPPGDRRQPLPVDESGSGFWAGLPHYVLYPLVGLALGLACPAGAFFIRFWLADPIFKVLWIQSELSYNLFFYLYIQLGTVAAFMAFGYILGVRSESQRAHNKQLDSRIQVLHLKSVTDGLTGAYSHAYFQETLALELERARKNKGPLSVLMLDLDDFKRVNDTHGHLFGDRALVELVETVSLNIRREDVLGRYGGEEFAVVMPGADSAVAQRVAERVRRAVARASIEDQEERSLDSHARAVKMTVSIGIATFMGEGEETPSSLLKRADKCLYHAKRSGKNRTSSAA